MGLREVEGEDEQSRLTATLKGEEKSQCQVQVGRELLCGLISSTNKGAAGKKI